MSKQADIPIPAPDHLSERSRALWDQVIPPRISMGRLILLQEAFEALDRLDEIRGILDGEGLTTTTESTGAIHVHPLAKLETNTRSQFLKAWGQLGLDFDIEIDTWRATPAEGAL